MDKLRGNRHSFFLMLASRSFWRQLRFGPRERKLVVRMFVSPIRHRTDSVTHHLLAALCGMALVACGSSGGDSPGVTPDGGHPPDADSAAPKNVTLLLTGKVAGSLEPCG